MPRRGSRQGTVVPDAQFSSYYGRPILKEPTWKVPDVPLYLFLGGMAGSSAPVALLGQLTGRPGLASVARWAAVGGSTASVVALIHDLGRPTRFLNMLRVFKPTSPLSVGSWILAPFSGLTAASALSHATGIARPLGTLSGAGAAVLGPAMCTYTSVLLADTAAPSWHEAYRQLPVVFAGSAVSSGAGIALLAAPQAQQGPARRMAVLGAGAELAAMHQVENGLGLVSEPYRTKRAGTLLRAAKGLTAAGAVLSAASGLLRGRPARAVSALGGTSLLAGGLCTRFGIFDAGVESTRDPKYVVVPQKERKAARERAQPSD